MQHWIKNFDELAITENRKLALEIAEAGYDSINTEKVIENSIKIEDNTLIISGEKFDLAKKITQDSFVIDPWKKDEKNKSKVSKKAPKKVHSKSNASTVESIQK